MAGARQATPRKHFKHPPTWLKPAREASAFSQANDEARSDELAAVKNAQFPKLQALIDFEPVVGKMLHHCLNYAS